MISHPYAAALIVATAAFSIATPATAQNNETKPPAKEAETAKPKDCAEGYHMVGGRCLRDPAAKQTPASTKPENK